MTANLIDASDSELEAEQRRRARARHAGLCDACGEWHDEPSCGNPRHGAAASEWYRRWHFESWSSSYLNARPAGSTTSRALERLELVQPGTRDFTPWGLFIYRTAKARSDQARRELAAKGIDVKHSCSRRHERHH
ncbi:MAG TPA: hypothetical protein VM869_19385 [Enhygromyxa sp.]|nr:hypothetical protein [Enhygromyxa sp.]